MSTPLSARQRRRRDRLVQQAADLVKPIAQAYARQSRECVDDLIQVGLLAWFAPRSSTTTVWGCRLLASPDPMCGAQSCTT